MTAELAEAEQGLWLGLYQIETGLGPAKEWSRCVGSDAPSFTDWHEGQPDDYHTATSRTARGSLETGPGVTGVLWRATGACASTNTLGGWPSSPACAPTATPRPRSPTTARRWRRPAATTSGYSVVGERRAPSRIGFSNSLCQACVSIFWLWLFMILAGTEARIRVESWCCLELRHDRMREARDTDNSSVEAGGVRRAKPKVRSLPNLARRRAPNIKEHWSRLKLRACGACVLRPLFASPTPNSGLRPRHDARATPRGGRRTGRATGAPSRYTGRAQSPRATRDLPARPAACYLPLVSSDLSLWLYIFY